jgi:hypothetical protein
MNEWLKKTRFLWDEPAAPPRQSPDTDGPEPAGVPQTLRKAARFALIGVAATSLLGEVVGVRLTAPVDAAPSYVAVCIQNNCKGLTGQARADCNHACEIANESGSDPVGGDDQSSLPGTGISGAASQLTAGGASRDSSVRSTPKPRGPWWYEWVPFLSDQRSSQ